MLVLALWSNKSVSWQTRTQHINWLRNDAVAVVGFVRAPWRRNGNRPGKSTPSRKGREL